MKLLDKIKSLPGKQKSEFIAAAVLSGLLVIGTPVYAWFAITRDMDTITKVREPGDLILRAGKSDSAAEDADPIVNFEMKEIDMALS